MPQALPGYTVTLYAEGLENPRLMRTAPNGDLFVAETGPGRIRVLRGRDASGKPQEMEVFAAELNRPFGIAFYPSGPNPQFVYVAQHRLHRSLSLSGWRPQGPRGRRKRSSPTRSPAEAIRPATSCSRRTARRCGSASARAPTWTIRTPRRPRRIARRCSSSISTAPADASTPAASGTPTGLAIHPTTGQLWVCTNERDNLGDNLVPDYISHIEEGGFYGWPWYYLGGNPGSAPRGQASGAEGDRQGAGRAPAAAQRSARLRLLQRSAVRARPPLQRLRWRLTVRGTRRCVPATKSCACRSRTARPLASTEDFVTGFVTADGQVWGRPVGVAVADDGSLMVSDDGSNSIWQVSYSGKK